MLTKEVTQKSYCVTVGVKRLKEILDEPLFFQTLNSIRGISRVEYDGHFGPHVFLTLDVEDDFPETWAEIEEIINA